MTAFKSKIKFDFIKLKCQLVQSIMFGSKKSSDLTIRAYDKQAELLANGVKIGGASLAAWYRFEIVAKHDTAMNVFSHLSQDFSDFPNYAINILAHYLKPLEESKDLLELGLPTFNDADNYISPKWLELLRRAKTDGKIDGLSSYTIFDPLTFKIEWFNRSVSRLLAIFYVAKGGTSMNQDKFNTFIYRAVSEGLKNLERKDINNIACYVFSQTRKFCSLEEINLMVKKAKQTLINYDIEEI